MAAPTIPGFYFDQERNRYFRIVQSGEAAAPPTSQINTRTASEPSSNTSRSEPSRRSMSRYTNSVLEEERKVKKRKANQVQYNLKGAPAIPPSMTCGVRDAKCNKSDMYLYDYFVNSKQGCRSKWSSFLQTELLGDVEVSGMASQKCYELSSPITAQCYDSKSGVVYLGHQNGTVDSMNVFPGGKLQARENYESIKSHNSAVYSLNLGAQNFLISTTFGQENKRAMWSINSISPGAPVEFEMSSKKNIWSSAVFSNQDSITACLGLDDEFSIYNIATSSRYTVKTKSAVLALDTASNDTKNGSINLAVGLRNGTVGTYDMRSLNTMPTRQQPIYSFKHGSAVTNIKSFNENYILVSGLEDSLKLYDWRYCKPSDLLGTSGPEVLKYKGYVNNCTLKNSVALSSDSSKIAVSSWETSVIFYHTWTGKRISMDSMDHSPRYDSVHGGQESSTSFQPQSITGLDWTDSNHGLLVSRGKTLEYWGWNNYKDV